MPETKPQDYTKGELIQAANICRDAAEHLDPAPDELGRIIDDLESAHVETALFYSRTRRYLLGASIHLRGSVIELHQIAETTGRKYASVKSKLLLLNLLGWAAGVAIAVLRFVLPAHAGHIAVELAPMGVGFAIGATVSLAVLEHYITGKRRSDGR